MSEPKVGDPLFFIYQDKLYSGTYLDTDTKLLGTEMLEVVPDEGQDAAYPVYMLFPSSVIFLEKESRIKRVEGDEGSESGDLFDYEGDC